MSKIQVSILIAKHIIPNPAFFQASLNRALQWIADITGGELTIAADIVDRSNKTFTSYASKNTDNADIYVIDPNQIAVVGSEMERANQKDYSIITLFTDYDEIKPYRPTFDSAFPMLVDGFTISHMSMLKTDADIEIKANYIVHEWLHNMIFLLQQKGVAVQDTVHQHSTIFDPRPEANLSDVLLKLKPHWGLLAAKPSGTSPQPTPPPARKELPKMLAFKHKGTIYVAVFAKFVPMADEDTFIELGGNWNYVKELTDAEFNSIVKPYLATKSVLK